MAARSFLGAGDIYLERLVDGISQGVVGPIFADKMEIKPNVDTKQATSKGRYTYGQVLDTVNIQKPVDFTMDLTEVTGDILTIAFLGTSSALSVAAGTMADQAVTIKKGFWVDLGHKNLADIVTVENTGGTTTYVEGVDYKLNRPIGLLMVLPGSAILDAASLRVSGGYKATTGTRIAGGTRVDVRAKVVFDGINQADGTQVTVNVWEAVIAADSAFDFLADDFGKVSLKGTLKTPLGKDAPFEVLRQDAVAA